MSRRLNMSLMEFKSLNNTNYKHQSNNKYICLEYLNTHVYVSTVFLNMLL